jgi:hypothetical protein
MRADRHEDVAGLDTNVCLRQIRGLREVELVKLEMHVLAALFLHSFLGKQKTDKKESGERNTSHRRSRLCKEIHNRDKKQDQGDQSDADGHVTTGDLEIERNAEFPPLRLLIAQHENGNSVQHKTPNHAKSVEVGEKRDIAAAHNDHCDLKANDHVDNSVGGSEAGMRLTEPVRQNAILGNSVENAIGTYDCGVDRAGKNQGAHDDHEDVEGKPCNEWTLQTHGESPDQVLKEMGPRFVRNNHHREERNERREYHAVNKNDEGDLF